MTIEKRSVSYSYDSTLENAGLNAYYFDCFVWRDGKPILDEHKSYPSREALFAAMEGLVPLLQELPQPAEAEPAKGCAAKAAAERT